MISLIDYGASNLQSVCNALEKLGKRFRIVTTAKELAGAEKVILPGVGAAKSAMKLLKKRGFVSAVPQLKVPFLGICLGLQLLADFSEEGDTVCLSVIPGQVKRFPPTKLKVPHMGWNAVEFLSESPLLRGISNRSYFYFVHSYVFDAPQEYTFGQTLYGIPFASIIARDNFSAVQFHPEKSGPVGLKLLQNFCEL